MVELYTIEERLERIENMLKFIVDNTIASGILEAVKTDDNMTDECRDNLVETIEILGDESARFMGRYLDEYFEDNEEDEFDIDELERTINNMKNA